MSDVLAALVPSMVGLVVTPGAVVACLLLLASSHPVRNVAAFATVFVGVYAVIAAVLVAVARTTVPAGSGGDVRTITHLVVGLLFLTAAGLTWHRGASPTRTSPLPAAAATAVRSDEHGPGPSGDVGSRPRTAPGAVPLVRPSGGWMGHLADPSLRLVLSLAALLAVVNPNVAILASGVSIVLAEGLTSGDQALAVAALLAATLVDFAAPTAVYALCGARGRDALLRARRWLVAHDHVIGLVVLLAFGLLFSVQALVDLV